MASIIYFLINHHCLIYFVVNIRVYAIKATESDPWETKD